MPLKLGLVHRHVLDRRGGNPGLMGDDPIHQREGITVREQTGYLLAGEHDFWGGGFSHKAAARSV